MATKKSKPQKFTSPQREPNMQEANYLVTAMTNVSMRLANLESHFNALATNVLQLSERVMAPVAPAETASLNGSRSDTGRTSDH